MAHDIIDFSSVFAFGHSAFSLIDERNLCYDICKCRDSEYHQIFEAVQTLSLKYTERLSDSLSNLVKNNEILRSKKKFMSYVLSRCLKLSETPSFFSFLAVCIFIDAVVFGVSNNVECFNIVRMASKCLIATFNRRFVDVFDKENGFKGFNQYCAKLNAILLDPWRDNEANSETDSEDSLDLQGFIAPDTDEIFFLLHSFREIDDSEFSLTDSDKKLLYDRDDLTKEIDASEDIFLRSKEKSESDDEMVHLILQNLDMERVNQQCLICEDNCYKHIVDVANKLGVEINIDVYHLK